ncbi:hypothetical protein [Pseudorhodoplanes sp.]|uniref:hypothetical protein n=1 Tax=Pseudorhodoplanes sp. TaxID=1934341 RepID=UPI002B9D493C|nr:hypothetical protein [Pseudorhodoplanes sp.]HWV55520.1 hypothetical protein [Pseudorhodoplanes sp.]
MISRRARRRATVGSARILIEKRLHLFRYEEAEIGTLQTPGLDVRRWALRCPEAGFPHFGFTPLADARRSDRRITGVAEDEVVDGKGADGNAANNEQTACDQIHDGSRMNFNQTFA